MAYGGKVNLGLCGVASYNGFNKFLNIWKEASTLQLIAGGVNKWDYLHPNETDSAWPYLTSDGELKSPLDGTVTHLTRIIVSTPSEGYGPGYNRTNEAWVVKWTGTANSAVISGVASQNKTGSRIDFVWGSGTSNRAVTFSNFDYNNPPRNIAIVPAKYEALYDAGEIFHPEWLAEVRRGSGVVRYMDWMVTNSNKASTSVSMIALEAHHRWGSSNTSAGIKGGMPLTVMSKLANKVWSNPWVCIPAVLGTPKTTTKVTGITLANPPVVTAPDHSFVNGDLVNVAYASSGLTKSATVTMTINSPCVVTWTAHGMPNNHGVRFSGGTFPTGVTAGQTYYVKNVATDTFEISATPGGASINTTGSQTGTHTGTQELLRNTYTVANVTSTTFELSGANATGYGAMGSTVWMCSPYSLSGMTTEVGLLAAHFRDNVRPELFTIFELSNEDWNFASFDQFFFFAAQARAKFPADNSYRMTGYLAAHCMRVVYDTYGAANRSRWKGCLGTFLALTSVMTEMLVGVDQYISENPGYTRTMLFDYGAVSSYWGENMPTSAGTQLRAVMDESELRFNNGTEATKYSYFTRYVEDEFYDGRYGIMTTSPLNTVVKGLWASQKTVINNAGLTMVAYEGGMHTSITNFILGGDGARFLEFLQGMSHSAYEAAYYDQMFSLFANYGIYPAKFVEAGPVSRYGSFGGLRQIPDSNPVWDATVAANGVPKSLRFKMTT